MDRPDSIGLTQIISKIAAQTRPEEGWKVMNVLHKNSSQVAALDLGYNPGSRFTRLFVIHVLIYISQLLNYLTEYTETTIEIHTILFVCNLSLF